MTREIDLLFSTGDPVVDRVLRGWIAVYEAAFPGRLRELCGAMPEFENYILERYREFMLGRVLFPGDREVERALGALASHETPLVRMAAQASLEAMS